MSFAAPKKLVLKRLFPVAWRLTLAALLVAPLSGCYLISTGIGQAKLLLRRERVEAVLTNKDLDAKTRSQLELIALAKAYAEQEIGLAKTSNYTSLVRLDRDAVTYVVSAAPRDKLEAYTWWFPIIGSVPYKGYFAKSEAETEKKRLDDDGYDTILRGVPAFSTLGWLTDPVYSPILAYEPATLANVIIHETTHATLYLPGQAAFNEGFATFVGNQGAQDFLARTQGLASPDYRSAVAGVKDNAVFTDFVQEVSARLEALYASGKPRETILTERVGVFSWAKTRFETVYKPKMQGHQFRHFPGSTFNNAALISYRTYYNRLDRFEAAHRKLGSNLRRTVTFFKETVAKSPDPAQFLEDWLKADVSTP